MSGVRRYQLTDLSFTFANGVHFSAEGYGEGDIWVTKRGNISAPWGEPVNLGAKVNSAYFDAAMEISNDGLSLYFGSTRSGGYGFVDLWVTTRADTFASWEEPINLGPPVNTIYHDGTPKLSTNNSKLFLASNRPGGQGNWDLWETSILPIVDFNADGKIDNVDLLMLVESWGKNDPLYDIGPTPFGDGIVDIEDLEVFMSYWEEGKHSGESG